MWHVPLAWKDGVPQGNIPTGRPPGVCSRFVDWIIPSRVSVAPDGKAPECGNIKDSGSQHPHHFPCKISLGSHGPRTQRILVWWLGGGRPLNWAPGDQQPKEMQPHEGGMVWLLALRSQEQLWKISSASFIMMSTERCTQWLNHHSARLKLI